MAAATTETGTLSDQDLQELLRLAEAADSVELKLTVPELHHRSTVASLGIRPTGCADPPAVAGTIPLRQLFSRRQRALFADHAPAGIELNRLTSLGPIFVLKLNFVPEDLDRKPAAEMWLYPNGSRILELSTKCAPSEMLDVAAKSNQDAAEQ